MNLEIYGHADPAVLGHVTLLGGHETPAFHGAQGCLIEGLAAAALLNLDLAGLAAGENMYS